MIRKLLFVLAGLFVLAHAAFAAEFKIDRAHTDIGFRVKHLLVAKTTGSFTDFDGSLTYDAEDLSVFSLTATIQAASVDTNNEQRDSDLRSSEFLDVPNHPTITFTSRSVKPADDGLVVIGDLMIRGVTKMVELPLMIVGPVQGPGGSTVVGMEGHLTINRHDFGVEWDDLLDNGSVIVSANVEIEIHAEFIQQ